MFLAGIGPFGPTELIVILVILVMLFGATRLADIGGSLGKGIREFKKNVKDDEEEAAEASPPAPIAHAATTNGAETIAAVKCTNCGTLNPATAKHCTECGTALTAPVS